MAKCIIYKPARNLMQSGLANENVWKLVFVKEIDNEKEQLMGWESSFETKSQVVMTFSSKSKALDYAKKNNLYFEIKEENPVNTEVKSVSYNNTKDRNLYYF